MVEVAEEAVISSEEMYNTPSFKISFDSSYGNGSVLEFENGKLVFNNIGGDLEEILDRNYHNDNSYTGLGEANFLIQTLSGQNSIKGIYDFVNERYQHYKRKSSRPKRVKAADSFYLNLKKALAPFYTEIVSTYKQDIEVAKEEAKDDQTKKAYDDLLTDLEAENGPNIADIEKDRIIKGAIEGLLYGIPAIICIYLIIKKIRS